MRNGRIRHLFIVVPPKVKCRIVHRQELSELKIPYTTVVVVDFADLECEASAK